MATTPSHHRASLLSGLRTGGVRSVSTAMPRTAAVTGAFEIPRFVSSMQHPTYAEEYEDDFADMHTQNMYANYGTVRNAPMTAAVDGPRFSQQQNTGRGMNPNSAPFQPSFNRNDPYMQPQADQSQALQMQLMQLEILRLQAIQNQQYQTELLAQQQAQKAYRRSSFNPPATAGPFTTSFDQSRPTALRMPQNNLQMNGRYVEDMSVPPTPTATTVISGGTALGVSGSHVPTVPAPSKSDAATSWRRGGNNNSVLSGQNRPIVKVTPPPSEQSASPPLSTNGAFNPKFRPRPLQFNSTADHIAAVSDSTEDGDDDSSTSKSSSSSPTTPHSSASNESSGLSPREEASKKLYAGLGVGRPNPSPAPVANLRLVSQPLRQPRGPPSGIDELGPKNFASRIRRQAIGGLSALMGARERREVIEAY